MEYYRQPPSDTLHALDSTPDGLTPAQAAARLARDGRNVLTEPPKPSLVKRFFQQLADPMILVLLAAALISAITSAYAHESFADVIIILIVVIINAVLGVYQESKAEQAIAALKELSAAHSRVLRGGKLVTVPSEKLVVGDVLVLEAGDAVPADARVLESASLRAEEAALTGESVPVTKSPDALTAAGDIGPGDRSNMLYLGSSIVYGRGRAVVTETGMQTQMGHIADALTQTKENKTPLQLRLTQLSRILTWLVLGICAVVFAVGVLRAGTINGRVVLDTFLIAVSLAVAAIPEGLAAVVTIVLSIGVTNMSRRGAVIRRLTAVETLGCAQVICSDKTGTLTQNRMTVTECAGSDEHLLATAMALCVDAVHDPETDTVTGEPTEAALVRWAVTQGLSPSALRAQYPRVAEAPFDSAVTDTLGKYSNLTDLNTQNEVKKYLIDAGVSKKNVEAWLKDVNEYNKTIKNTSLVKKGYKKLGLNVPVYNDTKIAEYWSKKYNMFIGYNCRITAFDLLKDYVKIGKNVKTDTTELFMDSDALKNSPYQKYNKKDTKKFEALYSSINTVYSTNTDKHISVFKKYRKKNDIKLANDKTKASLITVVFHSSFSKKENELFIGHAGVLVPLKNKKYIFIEKLSFQSPYQVIKFESKQQLNEYLMRMYDTEWGQDTAKPFIMENNDVLSCYHSVR